MLHPSLAGNPYALAAILAAYAFAFAFAARSQFRYAVVLSLITFDAMVLCQYSGCCSGTAGTLSYLVNRVASVAVGAVLPVLVANLVLPW
jgi:hypothetical protein